MSRNQGRRVVSEMFAGRRLSALFAIGAICLLAGCGGGISLHNPDWYGGNGSPSPTHPPSDQPKSAPQSAQHAPFELGEVVAQNDKYYREFWGMTPQGYYTVQDFYQKNQPLEGGEEVLNTSQGMAAKRTDPYTLVNLTDVQSWMLEDLSPVQQYNNLGAVEIDGPYVQWYPNGGKAIEGHYESGRQQGVWTVWYDSGKMMLQETLLAGSRHGDSKGWHKNGTLAGSGTYADNMRQGVWTVWYDNGAKMQEGTYDNDMRSGLWTFYYDNGNRKEAGSFENGEHTGIWQWWDLSGTLVREGAYSEVAPTAVGSGRIKPRNIGGVPLGTQ